MSGSADMHDAKWMVGTGTRSFGSTAMVHGLDAHAQVYVVVGGDCTADVRDPSPSPSSS